MSEQQSTETAVDPMDDLDAFATEFLGGTPEAKPDAKQEADQDEKDETEHPEDKEAQATDEPEADEDDDEAEPEKPAPKKSKVQERIDELVKQREDEKRDAKAREAALRAEFEAKLAALAPKAETKTDAPTPDDLKADGSPKYELGEYDPAYIRDLTKHTLETERAQMAIKAEEQRQADKQQAETTALAASWNEKVQVAKERIPDLQEKGEELLAGFANLDQGYAGYLSTVLMSMDHGPDVLYYLATNPAEARTIVNSGAQKATLALGRIEAKFIEAAAQKVVAKPKVSNAPPPPVATARGTAGGSKTFTADTDDLSAFERQFYKTK